MGSFFKLSILSLIHIDFKFIKSIIMEQFTGTWVRTDHHNYKEYLKMIGINKIKRELALQIPHDQNTVSFEPIANGFKRKIKVGKVMSQTDEIPLDKSVELSDDTSKHFNYFTLIDDGILENKQIITKAKAADKLTVGQVIKQRNTVMDDMMFVQIILNE